MKVTIQRRLKTRPKSDGSCVTLAITRALLAIACGTVANSDHIAKIFISLDYILIWIGGDRQTSGCDRPSPKSGVGNTDCLWRCEHENNKGINDELR